MPARSSWFRTLLFAMCAPVFNAAALQASAAEAVARPAVDGILSAFDTHRLVAIGEQHELANLLTFYAVLVRDPRFASTVGNVVVEFGASQHQGILDRYVAGEEVPIQELSKVWRNTVAFSPSVSGIGYQTFFAQVRAVNLSLPRERQIRVWLSEPPIDWSALKSAEEWQQIYDGRDRYAGKFIVDNILKTGRKALVIYGSGHFFSYPWPSTWPKPAQEPTTLREEVERNYPDAFYVITPYVGFDKPGCSAALESEMKWSRRTLIAPIRGTALEKSLTRPECMAATIRGLDPLPPADEAARLLKRLNDIGSGVLSDAVLYLAPAADLMAAPADPALWMDIEYFNEIARRAKFRGGTAVTFAELLPFVAAPPRSWQDAN